MNKILLLVLFPLILFSQNEKLYTLSGYVSDLNNGESLIGVNIVVDSLNVGTTSNSYGFYSLTLPEGKYDIRYTYIGYAAKVVNYNFNRSISGDMELSVTNEELDEVLLSSEKNIVEKTQTSEVTIPIKQIFKIPALLGEVDVLKAIQLLPGVQSSEGTSGFYVRGGGPDQNLIL